MSLLLLPLENELPIPAWGYGLVGFGILFSALLILTLMGSNRPHS